MNIPSARNRLSRRTLLLGLEFAVIFVGAPFLIVALKNRLLLIGLLWLGALAAHLAIRGNYRPRLSRQEFREGIKPVALRFAVLAPIIAIITWVAMPDSFLAMPRTQPELWLAIMILYPVFSVWPQEMLYRALIYHRYAPLFGQNWGYIAASALAFGYAHIIFLNFIAVVMTGLGGFLFARDYAKHRSVLLVCLEHALYGCLIFTAGLGRFFYSGAVWHHG